VIKLGPIRPRPDAAKSSGIIKPDRERSGVRQSAANGFEQKPAKETKKGWEKC